MAEIAKSVKMAKNVKNGHFGQTGPAFSKSQNHSLTPLKLGLQICPQGQGSGPQKSRFPGSPKGFPKGTVPCPAGLWQQKGGFGRPNIHYSDIRGPSGTPRSPFSATRVTSGTFGYLGMKVRSYSCRYKISVCFSVLCYMEATDSYS